MLHYDSASGEVTYDATSTENAAQFATTLATYPTTAETDAARLAALNNYYDAATTDSEIASALTSFSMTPLESTVTVQNRLRNSTIYIAYDPSETSIVDFGTKQVTFSQTGGDGNRVSMKQGDLVFATSDPTQTNMLKGSIDLGD